MSAPAPVTLSVPAASSTWTRSGVVLDEPLFSGQTLTVAASGIVHWSAGNTAGPEGLGSGFELVSSSVYAAAGSTSGNPIYRYGLVMLFWPGDGTGDGPPPTPNGSGSPNPGGVTQSAHVTMPVTVPGGGPRVYSAAEVNAFAPSFPSELYFIGINDDLAEDNSGAHSVTITLPDPTPPKPTLSATPRIVGNVPTISLQGIFPA